MKRMCALLLCGALLLSPTLAADGGWPDWAERSRMSASGEDALFTAITLCPVRPCLSV